MIKTRGGIMKGMKQKAMGMVSLVYGSLFDGRHTINRVPTPERVRTKGKNIDVTRGWEGVISRNPLPTSPLGRGRSNNPPLTKGRGDRAAGVVGGVHATSIQNLIDRINHQKRYRYAYRGAIAVLIILLLLLMGVGMWGFVRPWVGNADLRSLQIPDDQSITLDVLALRERPPGVFYRVNIPAYFTDQVTFQADVTGEDITMDLRDGEIYASNRDCIINCV